MHYLWWIPAVIIYFVLYTWISKQNNEFGGKWMLYVFIAGLWPAWMIISRISKNIIFDGMLYDVLMFMTYTVTMTLLGAGAKFTNLQWIGVGVTVVGFTVMHVNTETLKAIGRLFS